MMLHGELNTGSTLKLKLKGGLDCIAKGQSVRMSNLLQSTTFLSTFSGSNRREKSIMKNLLFRVNRLIREKFEEACSVQTTLLLPNLIIRYLECALVFIANDAERPTQLVRFGLKDELNISVLILILTAHAMQNEPTEERFNFLLAIFKKSSVHIPGVQKYF